MYEVTFEERYLQIALDTQKVFDEKFFDHEEQSGYFYTSSNSSETFVRTKPGKMCLKFENKLNKI